MNTNNRDLFLLTKHEKQNSDAMKLELKFLNELLYKIESLHHYCIVNEIIDVNRYKIFTKPFQIHKIINERKIKPFVFIFNKN
jgi:hypothetical protein